MYMLINVQSHLDINSSTLKIDLTRLMISAAMLVIFLLFSPMSHADGSFDYQMKLAKMGNAAAEFTVGEMYENGSSVKKNQKEAKKWIKKAAAHGHETAKFKLWYWDIEKNGLKGGNKGKLDELRLMADDENPQAMYYVGLMYAYGVGLKKNYDKSLDWLNKATYVGVLQAEKQAALVRAMKQAALNKNRKAEKQSKAKKIVGVKKKPEVSAKKENPKENPKVTQPPINAKEKLKTKKKKSTQTDAKAKAAAAANAKIEAQAKADGEMDAYE